MGDVIVEQAGASDRVVVDLVDGARVAWASCEGDLLQTTPRFRLFELPRCPLGLLGKLGAGDGVAAVAAGIAEARGWEVLRAVEWPATSFNGHDHPESLGLLFRVPPA